MTQAIYFDMDGTIADLYGVENWLDKLEAEDVSPYEQAKPLVDMKRLNSICREFIAKGVVIGIISWTAKNGSKAYNRQTRKAKKSWIEKNLPCVSEFHVVQYGTKKHSVPRFKNSVLVDDNEQVRETWDGFTIDATNSEKMLENLELLLDKVQVA